MSRLSNLNHLMQEKKRWYDIQGRHSHVSPLPRAYVSEFLDCRRECMIADLEVGLELAVIRTHCLSLGSIEDLPYSFGEGCGNPLKVSQRFQWQQTLNCT